MFIPPEPAFDQQPPGEGESFLEADALRPGIGGQFYTLTWQVAGEQEVVSDRKPLLFEEPFDRADMERLHTAFVADPLPFVSVAARHRYLGVPIVICTVQIGIQVDGSARHYEERDETGWTETVIDCRAGAMDGLCTAGKRLLRRLADSELGKIVSQRQEKIRWT